MNYADSFETPEAVHMPNGLERVLERLSATNNANFGVTIAAPLLSPAQLFLAWPGEPAILWSASDQSCEVGLGSSAQCQGTGPNYLESIIEQAEQLVLAFQCVGVGAAATEPRFYGGYSSSPLNAGSSHWHDFPRAEFALPRVLYRSIANRASLTLFVAKSEILDAAARDEYLGQLRGLIALPRSSGGSIGCKGPNLLRRTDNPVREKWDQHVAKACEMLKRHELEKVVLAREVWLLCSAQPDIETVLQKLLGRRDGSVCFALRRGGSTFLGATPERLVSRRGSEIIAEALAGSAGSSDAIALQRLQSDNKNQLEHSLVVREIVARLQSLGARVDAPEAPQLRHFGHLVHLYTLLKARKLAPPHLLLLAKQLHPTPAVGGVPVNRALEFIRDHEAFDRGRYANPVGWFDASGDGELAVALRSGLITGREVRLYAGAGLVPGSEADAEWNETDLKFRSLFDALDLKQEGQLPEPTWYVRP